MRKTDQAELNGLCPNCTCNNLGGIHCNQAYRRPETDQPASATPPEKHRHTAEVEALRVKPLEWSEAEDDGFPCVAKSILGEYSVWGWGETHCWSDSGIPGRLVNGSLDDAKAAAQADYERRILSALATQPTTAEDQPAPAHSSKRYSFICDVNGDYMRPDPNGEWLHQPAPALSDPICKDETAPSICDCELSHNGIGLSGRECDCPLGEPKPNQSLPVMAMSVDAEDNRTLRLHFTRPVTADDRRSMLDAINCHAGIFTDPICKDSASSSERAKAVAYRMRHRSSVEWNYFSTEKAAHGDAEWQSWKHYDVEPLFASPVPAQAVVDEARRQAFEEAARAVGSISRVLSDPHVIHYLNLAVDRIHEAAISQPTKSGA